MIFPKWHLPAGEGIKFVAHPSADGEWYWGWCKCWGEISSSWSSWDWVGVLSTSRNPSLAFTAERLLGKPDFPLAAQAAFPPAIKAGNPPCVGHPQLFMSVHCWFFPIFLSHLHPSPVAHPSCNLSYPPHPASDTFCMEFYTPMYSTHTNSPLHGV